MIKIDRELEVALQAALLGGDRIMEIYTDPTSDFGIERKADNSPLTKADKAAHIQIVELLETLPIEILSEEGRSIPYAQRCEWERLWIVDPLDGTKEFIKRNGEFTVNIALVERGVPVLGVIYVPVSRELYFGASSIGAYKVCGVDSKTPLSKIVEEGVKLPVRSDREEYVVVASRSHLSPDTEEFIENLRADHPLIEMTSKGSSLKICLVAEGAADIYPRYAPTCEWDTAAGDAILRAAGGMMVRAEDLEPLEYNKENLLNPYFIAKF